MQAEDLMLNESALSCTSDVALCNAYFQDYLHFRTAQVLLQSLAAPALDMQLFA